MYIYMRLYLYTYIYIYIHTYIHIAYCLFTISKPTDQSEVPHLGRALKKNPGGVAFQSDVHFALTFVTQIGTFPPMGPMRFEWVRPPDSLPCVSMGAIYV